MARLTFKLNIKSSQVFKESLTNQMRENSFKISRNDGAKLLKVSVRTLDRYIKTGKLSTKELDGRVLLSIDEIKNFNKKSKEKYTKLVYRQNSENVYRQNDDFVYTNKQALVASKATKASKPVYRQNSKNVYRQNDDFVYTDDNKKKTVSSASVHVENPMLEDLKKQLKESIEFQQSKEKTLLAELSQISFSKKDFEKKLRIEKIKRRFFLFLLLILASLQPIWIYLYFIR
jgi:hypothetical protein